jgi:cytoskeletal protein CcmA (bactofilin family)
MTDNKSLPNGLPPGKHTLVEEGTEFAGTLSSKCPIVVMGKVEGEVKGPIIHVTKSGVVAGNVKVQELRSDGELAGEVQADTVRISGKVRDHTVIKAKSLEVKLQVEKGTMEVVFGECELAVGDEPNKEAAIAAATAVDPKPAPPPPPAVEAKPDAGKSAEAARRTWSDTASTETATTEEADGKRRRNATTPPQA